MARATASAIVLVLGSASCGLVLSFDEYSGSPPARRVGGVVQGLENTTVGLRLNGSSAIVAANGPFTFPDTVPEGARYIVTVDAPPPRHACTVAQESGTAGDADITNVVVSCPSSDARLAELSLSIGPLSPAFDPERPPEMHYRAGPVHVPLLLGASSMITARSLSPSTRIDIAGMSALQQLTTSFALVRGPLEVGVTVTPADQSTTRYVIDVDGYASDYLKASNTVDFANFGLAVAIAGDTLAVGAPGEKSAATGINGDQNDTSANQAGAVYIFTRSGGRWSQQAYIKASNTAVFSNFGEAVALSGETLVVGAPLESATDRGAVYVFTRSGGVWAEQALLRSPAPADAVHFGHAVAIDGDTLVVGAPFDGVSLNGAAYVFQRTGTSWASQGALPATPPPAADSLFGSSVAISGGTAAVGAPSEDAPLNNAGAVRVFTRSGATWSEQQRLTASVPQVSASFGSSVALLGDTLAVGSNTEESNATGVGGSEASTGTTGAGAVFVFERAGTVWTKRAYVKSSNTRALARFGQSVALTATALLVGSENESSNARGVDGDPANTLDPSSGAAYLFVRSGASWTQRHYLKPSNTRTGIRFGASVALSGDTVVVGGRDESSGAKGINGKQDDLTVQISGAVYVF